MSWLDEIRERAEKATDQDFIAHVREDVLKLIAYIDKLHEALVLSAKQISHEMADEIIMQLLDIDRPVYAGAYLREKPKDYSDGYRDALRKCVEVARYVKDTYHPEVTL